MLDFVTGDPQYDFFEQNPELLYVPEFKELIKDAGAKAASDIMWATYLYMDPGSKFFRYSESERKKIISETYLNSKRFPWDDYKWLHKAYSARAMSKKARQYQILYQKYEELLAHVDELDPSIDSEFKKITTILEKAEKFSTTLEKIEAGLKEEREKISLEKGRGGHTPGGLYKHQQQKQNG